MPDVNHTQGLSNDAPRDPLDDLIAPILGRDVTPNRHTDSNHEVIRMAAPISWHQHRLALGQQSVLVISHAGRNALHRKRAVNRSQPNDTEMWRITAEKLTKALHSSAQTLDKRRVDETTGLQKIRSLIERRSSITCSAMTPATRHERRAAVCR